MMMILFFFVVMYARVLLRLLINSSCQSAVTSHVFTSDVASIADSYLYLN